MSAHADGTAPFPRTRVIAADCHAGLRQLPAASVHAVATSPPYLWLRSYGTAPQVWGDPGTCDEHQWQPCGVLNPGGSHPASSTLGGGGANHHWRTTPAHALHGWLCHCGAWRGELGLEPTVALYLAHLVEVFREVRRVLRPDGTLWLNLGDTYTGSGKGPTGQNGFGDQAKRQGFGGTGRPVPPGNASGVGLPPGSKPKDLLLLPYRVALALQADGWTVRSDLPWLKRSAMPESVHDRFSSAKEVVFQLTRSRRYYWDAEAVRMGVSGSAHARGRGMNPKARVWKVPSGWNTAEGSHDTLDGRYRPRQNAAFSAAIAGHAGHAGSRNRRNSDAWYESLDDAIEQQRSYLAHLEAVRDAGGLLLDEGGDPLALLVNPKGYQGAHFATFPEGLVEPLLRASTSERGCCAACGAPWLRQVERTGMVDRPGERQTVGWQPSCACAAGAPVPCEVLDPFFGAGTVGVVANRLGRHCTGIEIQPDYATLAVERNMDDAPLFARVERAG